MKTKNDKMIIMHSVTLFAALLMGQSALGDGRSRRGPPAEVKDAFEACFKSAGLKVTGGERPELTEEQRDTVGQCLAEKGVRPPGHGERHGRRPSNEQREKMKACLTNAGVSLPERGQGRRGPGEMDEATRAAFDQCRRQIDGAAESIEEESASTVSSAS